MKKVSVVKYIEVFRKNGFGTGMWKITKEVVYSYTIYYLQFMNNLSLAMYHSNENLNVGGHHYLY